MRRWLLAAALVLAASLALSASLVAAASPGSAEAQVAAGRVRVVQVIPDGPLLDIPINSNPAFCSLAFRAVTRYSAIAVGTYNLQAVPAATGGSALVNTLLKVEPNASYSVVLLGRQASAEALILIDDLSAPPAGSSKVRLVNAVPGAPAVDVAVEGGPVLFHGVGFKGASGYVTLKAGSYNVQVRDTASGSVLARIPGVQVGEGVVYTVYAAGLPTGQPAVQALITVESVGGSAVPAVPDAPQ